MKPTEVALLFEFEISKEKMDEHRMERGWSTYEYMDEARGVSGFWDDEKWMLFYQIDEDFGKEHGVWYGEIVTFSENPGVQAMNRTRPNEASLNIR